MVTLFASIMQRSDKLVISFLQEQNRVLLEVIGDSFLKRTYVAQQGLVQSAGHVLALSTLSSLAQQGLVQSAGHAVVATSEFPAAHDEINPVNAISAIRIRM